MFSFFGYVALTSVANDPSNGNTVGARLALPVYPPARRTLHFESN
jgi:hypothetical protein